MTAQVSNLAFAATARTTPRVYAPAHIIASDDEALRIARDLAQNFATDAAGTEYDISRALPVDVASQYKKGRTATDPYEVEVGVAVPCLYLEQLTYRYGVSENAQQSCTLRGDSIFYAPGSVYVQEVAGTNAANQNIVLTNDAYPYKGDVLNGTRYALGVMLKSGKRLLYGTDYTETAVVAGDVAAVTVKILKPVPATDKIRVTYSSDTVASYPQASHAVASATRPAAIRGRNIRVFVGGTDLTDVWTGVQSFNLDWRVQLDRDLEFGNSEVVSQDFEVPTVNGSIEFKPRDARQLYQRIAQVAGAASETEVVGALQQVVLPLEIVLYSPEDGTPLKTLYTPDVRFTVPGYSGRVQQKLTVTFNFESDSGQFSVFKGLRP